MLLKNIYFAEVKLVYKENSSTIECFHKIISTISVICESMNSYEIHCNLIIMLVWGFKWNQCYNRIVLLRWFYTHIRSIQ